MNLALPLQGDRARYDITVVSHESDPPGKESKRFSRKGYSRVKNIGTKAGAAFIALMIAGLMLLGNVSTAPSAQADSFGIFDGIKDTLCSSAYFDAEPEDRGLGANTQPITGNTDATKPAVPDASAKLTAYEKYGMAGMKWTVWLGAEDHDQLTGEGKVAGKQLVSMGGGKDSLNDWAKADADAKADAKNHSDFYNTTAECFPMGNVGPTTVGNFLLSVTSWIVNISNLLFQTATETSSSVIAGLEPTIVDIVTELKDSLYLEFLAPVLMFGALYLGWKGLVKRSSTEAGTSALWMFGATAAGFAILANPMFIPGVVNSVVSSVSETTIAAITRVALKDNHSSGVTAANASLCTLDGGNGKTKTTPDKNGKVSIIEFTASQDAARTSVRQIQCTLWYSFMYTPWVIGQYGVSPSAADNTVLTSGYSDNKTGDTAPLAGTTIPKDIALGSGSAPGNWALYQLDNKVNYPGSNKSAQEKAMLNVAASQLYKPDANTTWQGTSSLNRVTTATLAMISALGAGAMIAAISMSMIVLQIGLVILTLFSALFLLVGVHPGFGRRVALGWLESMAGLAMKRIVLSVLLSVMLVFYSAVLSASASMDWLTSMIMVIAVSIGGISYKDQITGMMSRINLGGNGGLPEQDMGSRHAKRAVGGAIRGAAGLAGAATALGVGAVAGGAGARKHNKELQQKARDEIANRRKGDDPSAGAGERPSGGPNVGPEDSSPVDPSGAGERPESSPNAGEIDGQGELFPEADVRPQQADPRLSGDIAAGQDLVNDQRKKLNNRAGIEGYRPATEEDGRRAIIQKAQEDALRENVRYNRFQKINAVKKQFENKIDDAKGTVERTVGLIGDKKVNATNAVTRSVANSAPGRAAIAAAEKAARAKEAARSYHELAKTSNPRYNKAIERHNEKKVVKQERRVENQEIKKIVSAHSDRKSVAGEAMRQARARAKSRKTNELTKMIQKSTRRL